MPSVGPGEELPAIAVLQGKGEKLFVRKFVISGNSLVDTAVLQEALAPYQGRSLTLTDLQSASAAIALAYRKVGLMASCAIPKQEVAGGVVRLHVTEARFGGAVVDDKSTSRVKPELLVERFDNALAKGEPVNMFDLDRALLISNDLAGTSVSGGLAKGSKDGESRPVQSVSRAILRSTAHWAMASNSPHSACIRAAVTMPVWARGFRCIRRGPS